MVHTGENGLEEVNLKVNPNESNKHDHLTLESYPLTEDSRDSRDNHDGQRVPSEAHCIAVDGYGFDYVMVFKAEERGVINEYIQKTIRQIIAAGFRVRVYFSCGRNEIFCEMRAPVERIMQFADQVDRKILLDRFQLAKTAAAGDPEANILPIIINNNPKISFRTPYEFIYARYDRRPDLQNIYYKSDGMWHPFRSVVRLSLLIDILKAPMRLGGAGLAIDKMKIEGKIIAFFPKHLNKEKQRLREKWLVFWQSPWKAPYDDIKDYYGEKIGLYFHFLGHLIAWLRPLAFAGFITASTAYVTGDNEHVATLAFAPIVIFWAIVMLEFWKRKEKRVALEWGMIDFEEAEQARPEYKGDLIKSPINGRIILYYPDNKKNWRSRTTTVVIVSMIFIVVSCIGAVYAFRYYLVYQTSGSWGERWGGIITSVINAVQIQILNYLYKKIAVGLNDFENHRTATEYEDSLIFKLFCFTFCNSYGGFIYLAFIEPVIGIECEYNCVSLLATNLTIVFVVHLVVCNLIEVLIPFMNYHMRIAAEARYNGEPVRNNRIRRTQAEKGRHLEQYDPIMGTLMDYAELAEQFGYITLFGVVFPLAPFLALVNNYVEFRSDAFKLLTQIQRPVPRGGEDIGGWQRVFKIMTCISVITNSALICLIYNRFKDEFRLSLRLWLFILLQWVAFIVMAVLEAVVLDVPQDVTIQLQRTDFLSAKIIDKVPDEQDGGVREVDESALLNIKISISSPLPRSEEMLQRERRT